MRKNVIVVFIFSCLSACSGGVGRSDNAEIREVPFTDVQFTDRFWSPRIEINRTVSIPSAFRQCEINGRFDNFALAGGLIAGEHKGDFPFDDTDPYKIIEGASYSLAVKYDASLDAYLDSVITLIAAAQEADGYLTTCVTNRCERLSRWWGSKRWEKINSHELYNSGHLYEAAVAHYRATGKRTLLEVALKNADLVCRTFGLDEEQIKYPSGHPIIEMALVKLYKVTGDEKYLNEARYFVDEAGRLSNGRKPGIYSQDHKPVLEQDEIVGHAVRAGYFYSGVTDVAVLQHDEALLAAVKRVWNNMTGRKLYITGGIGSRAQGEGFGPDYELNNFNNYCETCASIANVYWNYRMFLATGEAKYVDVLERALYNGVIAGVSLSGDKFFYDNPLASNGYHEREEWFGCACCPGNITRFIPSVPGYAYAVAHNGASHAIHVNLYVEGNALLHLEDDVVEIIQRTEYPWNGDVELNINPLTTSMRFALKLRIPEWATGKPVPSDLYSYADGAKPDISLTVNNEKTAVKAVSGYAVIEREWQAGDKVCLHLDMPVRRVQACPQVEYDRGLLAMERGPVVYALEGLDQQTQDADRKPEENNRIPEDNDYVFDIVIPKDAAIEATYRPDLLNGIMLLQGEAYRVIKGEKGENEQINFKAIPYSVWNNRGSSQMLVWTPATAQYAIPCPSPTLASQAEQTGGYGFNDRFEPKSSSDINTPYHYWWQKAGTEESIGYKFCHPQTVSATEVYWLAFEHYDVIYRAPESWRLLYKDGEAWKEVTNASEYGTATDCYNRVTFDPITTDELQIKARLRRGEADDSTSVARYGYSGGVIEWRVY
jgi:DUF1680 family protein